MQKHYQWAWLMLVWLIPHLLFAQVQQYSGTILSASDNNPIPGVNVVIKGTTTGASTDFDGNFKISASEGSTLVFSYIGFKTQEVLLGSNTTISIKLEEDVKVLGDVVVVGYGTAKKKDLTGSITSISSKEFQNGVITTPEQLISGKAAGVQITPNGGGPGSGSVIRIRGGASLNASNDPLIVIDGVPVANSGIAGSPNPLSLLNPNDIENISILKDASAAAIYGSRASNGVIIITTKKGSRGEKPTITLSSQNSISVIPKFVDVLSANEVRALVREKGTPAQQRLITDSTTSTDWQKEIYQLARTFDQTLSYGGELFNTPFRISAGYLDQTGILRTDRMQRISNAINISPSFFNSALKLNFNVKNSYSSNHFANQGAIGTALTYDPTKPVRATGDGSDRFGGYYEHLTSGLPTSLAPRNPVGMLNMQTNISHVYRSVGNVTVDYSPSFFPDISANLNLGYDASLGRGNSQVSDSSAMAYLPNGKGGAFNEYKQDNINKLAEFYLRYTKEIPDMKSRVEILGGTSFQDFLSTNYFFRGLNFNRDTIQGTTPLQFQLDKPQSRIASAYARLNYSYDSRYLLTLTVRRDGSSRFGRDTRWGTFPSAAVAWSIAEEAFLKESKVISTLKLRMGYGTTGQQDIGQLYGHLARYSIGVPSVQYPIGGAFTSMIAPIAYDPNIKWETTTISNVALDFGLYKDRISGSVDVYRKFTKDLLNTIPIPSGSNFSDQVLTNIGNIENRGVEITINTVPVQTQDFVWDFGFNVTFNNNKITKLRAVDDPEFIGIQTGGIGLGRTIQLNAVGGPLNSFYVLEQVYDANGKPVEGEFIDQNSDGIISEKDFVMKKQPWARAFFGISTGFTYKKLTFNMVWRGSIGNHVFANQWATSGTQQSIINNNPFVNNASGNFRDTQFSGNLVDGAKNTNRFYSDYYLRDASFFRADNINVSYNFGEVFRKARLAANLNLQNPIVITRYKGIDPEIFDGVDNTIYPRPRVFVLGLTLNY